MTINRPAASAGSHSGVPAKKMIFSLIVILSLTFLWCVISIFRSPHKYPIDDAYFYLVIAYNYSHGLGSTFTGFQPTNGYHPLWMLLLALVCRISPFGKAALIYEACALQFALMLVGCAAIFRIFRNSFLMAAWAIVIYEAVFLGKGTLSLMEIWLATPLLLISVLLLKRIQNTSIPASKTCFLLGITLAASSLARLELGFTSLLFWIAAIWITRQRSHPETRTLGWAGEWCKAIVVCLPGMILTFLAVISYLAINRACFGSAMPISGKIKSSFPNPHLHPGGLLGLSLILSLVIGVGAAIAAILKRKESRSFPSALGLAVSVLGGGLAISLCYDILFSSPAQWYFAEGYAYIILGLPLLLRRLIGSRSSMHIAGICLVAVTACLLNWLRGSTNFMMNPDLISQAGEFRKISEQPGYAAAMQLNSILPQHAGMLIRDSPGIIAYYTELRVFPADGLVAPPAYSVDVVKEGALAYFCKRDIHYVLSPDPFAGRPYLSPVMDERRQGNKIVFTIYSPLGHRSAGGWTVPDDPIRVFPEISPQLNSSFPTVSLREIPCNGYIAETQ